MSSTPSRPGSGGRANAPGQRPSVVMPVMFVSLLIVGGAVAYKMLQKPAAETLPAPVVTPAAPERQSHLRKIVPREESADLPSTPSAPVAAAPVPGSAAPAAPVAPAQPAVDPKTLLTTLTALNVSGPISAEDAQKWKAALQQLVSQGGSSISAIKDYLAQNQDINFAGVQGADQLGYPSLRDGLLNALGQIGGPDATATMLGILQSSTYPTDIATLANLLNQASPGQYQDQVLAAVRSQLAQAAQGQLNGANVAPLYALLSQAAVNGVDVSADLAKYSANWPYYTTIAMANMPNGAGVQSLVQMAQGNTGAAQGAAAQALAQLAPNNSQALTALMDMISQNQLPDSILSQIAPYLGGRENLITPDPGLSGGTSQVFHVSNGNQDFIGYDTLNNMSPEAAQQRINLIDQVLQSIPSTDTLAQQALQQQKGLLTGRLTGK